MVKTKTTHHCPVCDRAYGRLGDLCNHYARHHCEVVMPTRTQMTGGDNHQYRCLCGRRLELELDMLADHLRWHAEAHGSFHAAWLAYGLGQEIKGGAYVWSAPQ